MGGVLRSVGDVVTAPFKAAGQVLKGTGDLLGGVIGGAGKMLTGDFSGGLKSMGDGVVGFGKGLWKGTGELVHGALSGVEGLAGIAGGLNLLTLVALKLRIAFVPADRSRAEPAHS